MRRNTRKLKKKRSYKNLGKKYLRKTRSKRGGSLRVRNLSKTISAGPTFFPAISSFLKETINLGLGKDLFKNFRSNPLIISIN